MGRLDKSSRGYSVPVRGSIFGLNYTDTTERDISEVGTQLSRLDSDALPLTGAPNETVPILPYPSKNNILRILYPHYGDISECFADVMMTVGPGDSDLTMKLAIGYFKDQYFTPNTDYSDDYISASWLKIHGTTDPLAAVSGVISADLLNLLPALPEYGSTDFKTDAFVLIVAFNRMPTITAPYKFNYLNIHQSVTGIK